MAALKQMVLGGMKPVGKEKSQFLDYISLFKQTEIFAMVVFLAIFSLMWVRDEFWEKFRVGFEVFDREKSQKWPKNDIFDQI